MSEASTVAVATGDVSGDVRVAALSCDALGTGYDAADPLNVERRARSEETMANADLLLDQGTAQAPRAHQGAVTAVYLVRDPLDARVVISCGVDAKVRVWAFGQAEDTFSLTLARQLSTGEHTPTSICPLKRTEMLLAVGHAEGLVSVWAVDEDEPSLRSLCDDGGRRVVRLEARESNVVATDDQGSIMSFGLGEGRLARAHGVDERRGALFSTPRAGGGRRPDGRRRRRRPPPALRAAARAAARGRGRLRAALAADDAAAEPLTIVSIAVAAPLRVAAAVAAAAGALRGRGAGVASRPRLAVCPPAARGGDAAAPPVGVAADLAVAAPRAAARGAAATRRGRRRRGRRRAGGGGGAAVREPAAVLVRARGRCRPRPRAARPGADAGRGACAAQKPRAPLRPRRPATRRGPNAPRPSRMHRRRAATARSTICASRRPSRGRGALATKQKEAEAAVKARARDYVDAQSRRQRAYEAPENLVPVGLDAQPRRRVVPKQVDGKWLARLDALRPREADFPLPDDGADALAARVPAPAAPRVRAQLARLDDALGDAAWPRSGFRVLRRVPLFPR